MATLYVVAREIEQDRREEVVFQTSSEARRCYAEAHHVSENGPDDGDDPSIVSNCWLYLADASDPATARAMVNDGKAVLIASYWPALGD
jgi:hypothetical protein